MPRARDAVENHARDIDVISISGASECDGGSRFRLAGDIEHQHHRPPQQRRQIGGPARPRFSPSGRPPRPTPHPPPHPNPPPPHYPPPHPFPPAPPATPAATPDRRSCRTQIVLERRRRRTIPSRLPQRKSPHSSMPSPQALRSGPHPSPSCPDYSSGDRPRPRGRPDQYSPDRI